MGVVRIGDGMGGLVAERVDGTDLDGIMDMICKTLSFTAVASGCIVSRFVFPSCNIMLPK